GEGEGLAISGFGLVNRWGITMRGNVTDETQGIRLTTAMLVATEIRQGLGGERLRLVEAAGVQMRLAQARQLQHPYRRDAARGRPLQRPVQQPHSPPPTPPQHIPLASRRPPPARKEEQGPLLTEAYRPFEQGKRLGHGPLAEVG